MYPRYETSLAIDHAQIKALQAVQADGAFFSDLACRLTVHILRHGQSEGNARNIYQGRLDFPLAAQGEEQAKVAGEWLASHRPALVLASPMLRARTTAEIVAERAGGVPVEFLESLIEVDTGIFSGIEAEAAAKAHPHIMEKFAYASWDVVPEAESSASMYARAILSWQEVRKRSLACTGSREPLRIVVVTHGGLLQWLIRSTLGVHSWLPLFPMSNCGISTYSIEPLHHGRPAFAQWNAINFHPPGMPKGPKPVF